MNIKTLGAEIRATANGEQLVSNPMFLDETIFYSKDISDIKGKWDSITSVINKQLPSMKFKEKSVSFYSNGITAFVSPIIKLPDTFLFRVLLMESKYKSTGAEKPTFEMVELFNNRTKEHIKRVQDNLYRIADWFDFDKNDLKDRALSHDLSKYSEIEKEPYIWLTWYYKLKSEGQEFEYPEGVSEEIMEAIEHHKKVNPHHPEAHNSPSDMNNLDIAEMVADQAAMSQELNGNLLQWTKTNTLKEYKWKPNQEKLILELVKLFPELNTKESK